MEDYSKYLSYDNGKGILLSYEDTAILDRYCIDYKNVSDIDKLIYDINKCILSDEDIELEDVLIHLEEVKYYNYVKK